MQIVFHCSELYSAKVIESMMFELILKRFYQSKMCNFIEKEGISHVPTPFTQRI